MGMPRVTEKLWAELSPAEEASARALGFEGPVWDGEEEASASLNPEVDLFFKLAGGGASAAQRAQVAKRVAAWVVHPQWRGSSRARPWSLHFWSNGHFFKQVPPPSRKLRLRADIIGHL